jgi:hypothetical protein
MRSGSRSARHLLRVQGRRAAAAVSRQALSPASAAPRKRISEQRFEEHREILEPFMAAIADLGRLPEAEEFAGRRPRGRAVRLAQARFCPGPTCDWSG